jgi:hypothetical protein
MGKENPDGGEDHRDDDAESYTRDRARMMREWIANWVHTASA